MSTRVVLVDDHDMVRQGIRSLLENLDEFEVVGEATDGHMAIREVHRLRPEVTVMDLSMSPMNGFEATRRISAEVPEVRILCLSMYSSERVVRAALSAGAAGYVLKEYDLDELLRGIRRVAAGDTYISPRLDNPGIEDRPALPRPSIGAGVSVPRPTESPFTFLTAREREVLQLIAEGDSTKEVAARLGIAVKTASCHRERLMAKLDIHNVAGLVRYAIREGLASVDV